MTTSHEGLDELDVLERVIGHKGTLALRGKRPAPAQFMGLLGYSVEETTRYAAVLRHLIDRGVLTIVKAGGQWALAQVGKRAEAERDRLRVQHADPRNLLDAQFQEMGGLLARARGTLDDPGPLIERAQELLVQMKAVVSRLTS